MVKRIILFASGSGSNVENIIKYFKSNPKVEVIEVLTNNPKAGVIKRILPTRIPTNVFNKEQLDNGLLFNKIKQLKPDLIVLAGFLLKIPFDFTNSFINKIINIHPSLLPRHGGKGMYGERVHQSVKDAGDKETGITIHYVNQHYDEGSIIFQVKIKVEKEYSIKQIAKKVKQLEYKHYPEVIENLLFPKMRDKINIYTDGSSLGNPGPGGYGIVMEWEGNQYVKEFSDGFRMTTNNRMELLAVIVALESIKKQPMEVIIYSDSKYVVNAVQKKWVFGWEKKAFKDIKNPDLWQRYLNIQKKHKVNFQWIKGHNNHPKNERCDQLAVKAAKKSSTNVDVFFELNQNKPYPS